MRKLIFSLVFLTSLFSVPAKATPEWSHRLWVHSRGYFLDLMDQGHHFVEVIDGESRFVFVVSQRFEDFVILYDETRRIYVSLGLNQAAIANSLSSPGTFLYNGSWDNRRNLSGVSQSDSGLIIQTQITGNKVWKFNYYRGAQVVATLSLKETHRDLGIIILREESLGVEYLITNQGMILKRSPGGGSDVIMQEGHWSDLGPY